MPAWRVKKMGRKSALFRGPRPRAGVPSSWWVTFYGRKGAECEGLKHNVLYTVLFYFSNVQTDTPWAQGASEGWGPALILRWNNQVAWITVCEPLNARIPPKKLLRDLTQTRRSPLPSSRTSRRQLRVVWVTGSLHLWA